VTTKDQIEAVYPLTPMQQGMLFHTLLAPNSGLYFEQTAYQLHGLDNVALFETCWRRLVERHAILRSAFVWEGVEKMVQVVFANAVIPLETFDWRGTGVEEQMRRLDAYLDQNERTGFDIGRAPLARLALMRIAENDYLFVWSHHHALLDGWSMALLLDELAQIYGAASGGIALRLPDPKPYSDYVAWLEQQDFAAAERYWRQLLSGFEMPTPLPFDRGPRPAGDAYRRTLAHAKVSPALTERMQSFARNNQLTLATLIEGAWALLLSRYSGQTDVVFGEIGAGRPFAVPGAELMIGLFIKAIPVRVHAGPDEQFVPWLARLQREQAQAREYDYAGLVDILRWSAVPPGTQLFESLFVFENYPIPDFDAVPASNRLRVTQLCIREKENYPLSLQVNPGRELSLTLTYDPHRFDEAAPGRVLDHFQVILEAIPNSAECPLSSIPMLTQRELQHLVTGCNQTSRKYPDAGRTIPWLFRRQARATPDRTALVFENGFTTYGELDRRSDDLAAELAASGLSAGAFVPILLERGVDVAVAMLGVMKTGAAFVPVDPEWPAARIQSALADVACPVVLTDAERADIAAQAGRQAVLLSQQRTSSYKPVSVEPAPDDPIYAMYTSGSMGVPKAAVVLHRGITNRLLWMTEHFSPSASAMTLQTTNHVFDSAVWQIFWPLVNGSAAVLPAARDAGDPAALLALIMRHRITMTDFVPALFEAVVERLSAESTFAGRLAALQCVILGGEQCLSGPVEVFRRRFPDVRLTNLYGPTEASIGCVCYDIRGNEPTRIPIGKPIANTHLLLLDSSRSPVPLGATGEIYLGGICLGSGYMNNARQTREAFVPNPFESLPGAILYRTGDLGRRLGDENVEFLGRIDHQVKLRGYRVELGEIEAALEKQNGTAALLLWHLMTAPDRNAWLPILPVTLMLTRFGATSEMCCPTT
jgi:myxalamid-type nonribosomal peptide synthetase MxaA